MHKFKRNVTLVNLNSTGVQRSSGNLGYPGERETKAGTYGDNWGETRSNGRIVPTHTLGTIAS